MPEPNAPRSAAEVSRREPVLARRPAVAISMRVTGPSASAIARRPSRSATGRNGSSTRRSSSGTNGRLSACATGLPAERRHDLLGDDDAGAILRLARRARQVRREQEVGRVAQRRVGRQRLLREDVERGAREPARAQGLDERRLVDRARRARR